MFNQNDETQNPKAVHGKSWMTFTKVINNFYAPKTVVEKRGVAQEFDAITMIRGRRPCRLLEPNCQDSAETDHVRRQQG